MLDLVCESREDITKLLHFDVRGIRGVDYCAP